MGFKMNPPEPTCRTDLEDKETKEEVGGQSRKVDANMSRKRPLARKATGSGI